METIQGRLASPFSLPSTPLSSQLIRRPAAPLKRMSPRLIFDATSALCSSFSEYPSPGNMKGRRKERWVVSGARKKKGGKLDSEGYGPIPGENESFFPEAVLLKKKISQEDAANQPEFQDAEEEKLLEFLNLQLESDVKLERMRHYEVVYLIHEDHFQEVVAVIEKVQDFIREKKGRVWRLNDWGMRKLAYKIKKAKNANYVLMNFEIEARHINDFKNMLDRDERIIRHLVIKRDEAITEDCPPPPESQFDASDGEEDDDYDDDYDEEGFDDGDVDMEMDGDEGGEELGGNVFIIGDDEEVDDVPQDGSRQTKSKKRTGAASRS